MKASLSRNIAIIATMVIVTAALLTALLLGVKNPDTIFSQYYYGKVSDFKKENKTAETGGVVFLGDSITDMCDLKTYCADAPFTYYNRGISGDTTDGVLDRLDVSVYKPNPKVVVLLIGINDIARNVPSADILKNYRRIIMEIQNNLPFCRIVIQSVYPVNGTVSEALARCTPTIVEVNEDLHRLADDFYLPYVDVFSAIRDSDNQLPRQYADDGLHPNALGYTEIFKLLLPVVNREYDLYKNTFRQF